MNYSCSGRVGYRKREIVSVSVHVKGLLQVESPEGLWQDGQGAGWSVCNDIRQMLDVQ